MNVRQALSRQHEPESAVAEATTDWEQTPQIVFAFGSSTLDPERVSRALSQRFPGTPVVGCTTAGEHLGMTHATGSLALAAIWNSSMRWSTRRVDGLQGFDESRAQETIDWLFHSLGIDREELDPSRHVAMLVIDGLCMAEERVVALLAEALDGIPLVGGSAGDDLGFKRTHVITEDGAFSDSALVVLCDKGSAAVEIIKHQHYVTTPRALCITRADASKRVVYEIDGYPAIEAYAAALGLTTEQVTSEVTFLNPVTYSCNGEVYVRSIQKVEEDGSLTFYCGIEQGMVLEIAGQSDMCHALRRDLTTFANRFGKADLIVGFNCILRALEAGQSDVAGELGCILQDHSRAVIGFDTYGEQHNGLHINQTLIALAIKETAEAC